MESLHLGTSSRTFWTIGAENSGLSRILWALSFLIFSLMSKTSAAEMVMFWPNALLQMHENNYRICYIISVTHGLRCYATKSSLYAHNSCKARLPVRHRNCVPCSDPKQTLQTMQSHQARHEIVSESRASS